MALGPQPILRPADDRFAQYYAEKLWDWIPEIYRTEDGLAQNPGVLRAPATASILSPMRCAARSPAPHPEDWPICAPRAAAISSTGRSTNTPEPRISAACLA